MFEINNNLEDIKGGSEFNVLVCGLGITLCAGFLGWIGYSVGKDDAQNYQDGYLFTGIRGSGFEYDFMLALNDKLDAKKAHELQKDHLREQQKTNDILRDRNDILRDRL